VLIADIVKEEILDYSYKDNLSKYAFLSGALRGAGSLGINTNGINISFESQNHLLVKKVIGIIENLYNIKIEMKSISSNNFKKHDVHKFSINTETANKLLYDTGIIQDKYKLIDNIPSFVMKKDALKIDYLKGIFLSCGKLYVPSIIETENSQSNESIKKEGYHLEIHITSSGVAENLLELMSLLSIRAKIVSKKELYYIYIKGSENISDFLAAIGSSRAVMLLQEIIISRSIRNLTNRQYNCTIANINKSVSASQKQVNAIKLIIEKEGLDYLEDSLRKTAKLRLENPEYSLVELLQELGEDITKSGLNHRLRRIINIAENLKGGTIDD